jgi:hypothetical protein
MIIDLSDVPEDAVLSRDLLAPIVIDRLPERSEKVLVYRGEFGVFSGAVAFAIRADRDESEALDMLLCDAITKIGDPATEGWTDKYGYHRRHPAAQVMVEPKDYDDYGVGDDCRLYFADNGEAFDLEEGCAFREVADFALLPYVDRLSLAIALIRRAIEDSNDGNVPIFGSVVPAGALQIVLPTWTYHYRNWSDLSRNAGPAWKAMPLVRALVEAGIELDVVTVLDDDGNWMSAHHVLRLEDGCSGPASIESAYR